MYNSAKRHVIATRQTSMRNFIYIFAVLQELKAVLEITYQIRTEGLNLDEKISQNLFHMSAMRQNLMVFFIDQKS